MQRSDNNQPNPWSLIQRNPKFDCPYFTAHSDTVTHRGGKQRPYNHIHMKNFGIAVVPIDNDGSTTLNRTVQVPSGSLYMGSNERRRQARCIALRLSKAGTKGRDRLPCRSLAGTLCRFRFPWDDRLHCTGFCRLGT